MRSEYTIALHTSLLSYVHISIVDANVIERLSSE